MDAEMEAWKERVLALHDEGDKRAGDIGMACPKCWKSVPARAAPDDKRWCQCGTEVGHSEVVEALGLGVFMPHLITKSAGDGPTLD